MWRNYALLGAGHASLALWLSPSLLSTANREQSMLESACCGSAQVTDTATKLYKLHEGQGFALEAANTDPHFYDLNEDSAGTPPRWYLEVRCVAVLPADHPRSCIRALTKNRAIYTYRSQMWKRR